MKNSFYLMARTIFTTDIDIVMASDCTSYGSLSFIDLDYGDDVAILYKNMEIIHLSHLIMNKESQPLSL